MLDLKGVATFVEVIRRGSFRAAAIALDVTPSSISKKVTRLEAEVGAKLINRSTHDLTLTEAGTLFYEKAKRLLLDVEATRESVLETTDALSGTIRLHMTPGTGQTLVLPHLTDFIKLHSGLSFSINITPEAVDLLEHGFDISIRRAGLSDRGLPSTSIDGVQLAKAEFRICATSEYLRKHSTPKDPYELKKHNCLIYSRHETPREWWFRGPKGRYMVKVNGKFACDDWQVLQQATLAGLGIARLHTADAALGKKQRQLITIFSDAVDSNRTVWAYYPRMHPMPRKLSALLQFLKDRMGAIR